MTKTPTEEDFARLQAELQIARDALREAYERTGHADDLAAAHVADLALPPPVKEAEPEAVAWAFELAGGIDANGKGCHWTPHLSWTKPTVPHGMIRNLRALSATPPALQARVEALEGVTRDLRDRLLAFVGAVAEITDCSADVNAINRADALLDRAALTGEKGS